MIGKRVTLILVITSLRMSFFNSICFGSSEESTTQAKADKVIVLKNERKLILVKKGRIVKTYKIALGGKPKGMIGNCFLNL